mmetsp:Transcript_29713/g.69146  ORF Transcript_29713/g.69146 Transcript_29713/m.69146 type:complete len:299 (-) Transcript_29713:192-1088(-)
MQLREGVQVIVLGGQHRSHEHTLLCPRCIVGRRRLIPPRVARHVEHVVAHGTQSWEDLVPMRPEGSLQAGDPSAVQREGELSSVDVDGQADDVLLAPRPRPRGLVVAAAVPVSEPHSIGSPASVVISHAVFAVAVRVAEVLGHPANLRIHQLLLQQELVVEASGVALQLPEASCVPCGGVREARGPQRREVRLHRRVDGQQLRHDGVAPLVREGERCRAVASISCGLALCSRIGGGIQESLGRCKVAALSSHVESGQAAAGALPHIRAPVQQPFDQSRVATPRGKEEWEPPFRRACHG